MFIAIAEAGLGPFQQLTKPVDRSIPTREPLQELDCSLFSNAPDSCDNTSPLKSPDGRLSLTSSKMSPMRSPRHQASGASTLNAAGSSPPGRPHPHAGLLHSPLRSPLRKHVAMIAESTRQRALSSPLGKHSNAGNTLLDPAGDAENETRRQMRGQGGFVIHSPLRNADGRRMAR